MIFFDHTKMGYLFQSDKFIFALPTYTLNVFHVVQNYLGKFKISLFYDRIKSSHLAKLTSEIKGCGVHST